ncbi:MAG: flagellar protein export ATPase FliI [Gammaproteobacteria bacterium]|nr:flagellar protein export ATPase FliI [Gammaproteobacteria bacterium]
MTAGNESVFSGPDPDRNLERALRLGAYTDRALDGCPSLVVEGVLRRTVGLAMEAEGCHAELGGRCDVVAADGRHVETEVVGFSGNRLFLMPVSNMRGVIPNARVIPVSGTPEVIICDELLGRVLDGRGNPLDGGAPIKSGQRVPLFGRTINPLKRQPIRTQLDVGVRSINSLLSIGRGQRMGLFAGSGVGKSMLLGMMTRNTEADVVVVGLVGERGREVREFIDESLGSEGMAKAVVVATPADDTPLMRLHGAWLTAAIAEYFRDQGKNVLLLMDSLTRFAQAQREIALAIGEPPATKGYPPSVFAKMPQLVERAGNGEDGNGSISAIYTVLAEGDDPNDPIVDASRAILDGHIVLSRNMADAGIYPAIDVELSVSRAITHFTSDGQQQLITRFRQVHSTYQENRDLISVGAYQPGSNPALDEAVALWPSLTEFLRQPHSQNVSAEKSLDELRELFDAADMAHAETVE